MVVEIQITMHSAGGVVMQEKLRRTFWRDARAIHFAANLLETEPLLIENKICCVGEYTTVSGCLNVRVAREPDPEFKEG